MRIRKVEEQDGRKTPSNNLILLILTSWKCRVEKREIPLQMSFAVDEIEKPHPYAALARDEDQLELRLDWRQVLLRTHQTLQPLAYHCWQGPQEGQSRLNFGALNQILNLGVHGAEQRIVDTR